MPVDESPRQGDADGEESKDQESNEKMIVTHEVSLKSVMDSLSEKGLELD